MSDTVNKIDRANLASFISDSKTLKNFESLIKTVDNLEAAVSPGITTTVTTASLVGKTITIKNGIIIGFS